MKAIDLLSAEVVAFTYEIFKDLGIKAPTENQISLVWGVAEGISLVVAQAFVAVRKQIQRKTFDPRSPKAFRYFYAVTTRKAVIRWRSHCHNPLCNKKIVTEDRRTWVRRVRFSVAQKFITMALCSKCCTGQKAEVCNWLASAEGQLHISLITR